MKAIHAIKAGRHTARPIYKWIDDVYVVDIAVRYRTCHRRHRLTALTAERHRRSASVQDVSRIVYVVDADVFWPGIASPNPASCARYDFLCL